MMDGEKQTGRESTGWDVEFGVRGCPCTRVEIVSLDTRLRCIEL